MGCGASSAMGDTNPYSKGSVDSFPPSNAPAAPPAAEYPEEVTKPAEVVPSLAADVVVQGARQSTATSATGSRPLGKEKYVIAYGALAMDHRDKTSSGSKGTLFLFCTRDEMELLVFSYRDAALGNVYAKTFTDQELTEARKTQGVKLNSWAPFFKSIATALIKSKATITSLGNARRDVSLAITNSKDTSVSFPFSVALELVSDGKAPDRAAVFRYVLEPLTRSMQYNRQRAATSDREQNAMRLERQMWLKSCKIARDQKAVNDVMPRIRPMREESAVQSHEAMVVGREVRNLERRLRERVTKPIRKHGLDSLYDEGGAQYFEHSMWCPAHIPHEEEPDETLSYCIRATFPLPMGASLDSISQVLERPEIRKMIERSGNRHVIAEAFEIFKGIDRWDYDTIQLEIITNGNALFYTTYLLMYKLDLVRYFNIDDQVLRNFLVAVQSAYHPNPYHNAMHGADVTQINYYIMMVAGLADKCQLNREEVFAGLVAGAIHDFDHPGMNNNFHSRTNSYLATLYNDRSILENHHLACAFELMRIPRYNLLATLSDDQRQLVRDTMIEMVLATDMGNHAKIFKNFQVRMSETTDWHSKKEDLRLALCMSIKMADISNCARPNHIYAEWAKNISKEFYLQGDAERKLQLSISPFMDRTKEQEEFPKGQISFIMYIVQPMVEAISELLPSLNFAINLCNENKEYWKNKAEEATASEGNKA